MTIQLRSGVIDLNGKTLSTVYVQNKNAGENIILKNGTVNTLDGDANSATQYSGAVIVQNMTVSNDIYTDGHPYEIFNTTVQGNIYTINNGTSAPGTVTIYSGNFNQLSVSHYSKNGEYYLRGGTYKENRTGEAKVHIDGYQVQTVTGGISIVPQTEVASVTVTDSLTVPYATIEHAVRAWEFVGTTDGASTLKLLKDVETSSTITVPKDGARTLDLNGYGIKANASDSNKFSVITVPSGANLTLKDSRPEATAHYFTVADPATNGAGIATIVDKSTYDSSNETKGTFTGGYITGGAATNGGGVNVASGGSFTMTGGTIIGNTAKAKGGGGVYSAGTFTMSNGTIEYNYASMTGGSDNGLGGGVLIIDNTGVTDDFTMTGGTITGNKAYWHGGGMHIDNGATFKMERGTISNNTSGANGGGIALDAGASASMSGDSFRRAHGDR